MLDQHNIMLISLIVVLLVSSSSPVLAEVLNVTQIELGDGEAELSSVYWHHKVCL